MSMKIEVVTCPKCKKSKMVPLSKLEYLGGNSYVVVPLAAWKCLNPECNYLVNST